MIFFDTVFDIIRILPDGGAFQLVHLPFFFACFELITSLEKLKKRTDKHLKQCIKAINRDFKNTIRQLKITYPRVPDSKELNLSNKSKKDSGIAAATLERDRKIQELPKVQPLPFQN